MSDYILRSDAVFYVCKLLDKYGACKMGQRCPDSCCSEIWDHFADAQTVDAKPVVHGKWIDKSHEETKGLLWFRRIFQYRIVQCDQCGNFLDLDGVNAGRGDANFCPNCGAKMDRKAEEVS